MRLQKYLAHSGVASRRKSEEIISERRVKVNGEIIEDPAVDVSDKDIVKVDGKIVKRKVRFKYYLLNKPIGVVSTSNDEKNRTNVVDLIETDLRLYPVGRLDIDTTGIIILTNDGEFTNMMTHPKYELSKTYIAKVHGRPDKNSLEKMRNGIYMDNKKTKKAKIKILNNYEDSSLLEIEIKEGRNRQIRKMFDIVNHPIISLKRIKIGEIEIGGLQIGDYREFYPEEMDYINRLKNEKIR